MGMAGGQLFDDAMRAVGGPDYVFTCKTLFEIKPTDYHPTVPMSFQQFVDGALWNVTSLKKMGTCLVDVHVDVQGSYPARQWRTYLPASAQVISQN